MKPPRTHLCSKESEVGVDSDSLSCDWRHEDRAAFEQRKQHAHDRRVCQVELVSDEPIPTLHCAVKCAILYDADIALVVHEAYYMQLGKHTCACVMGAHTGLV